MNNYLLFLKLIMPTKKPGTYPKQRGNNPNTPQLPPRTKYFSEKSPSTTRRSTTNQASKVYPWNINDTAKSLANRNHKGYWNILYGTTLSNSYQKHHGLCPDDSSPLHKKKSRKCTNSSKNTCDEEPSVNPGAPTPPTSSL
jgi:hypothetical protein